MSSLASKEEVDRLIDRVRRIEQSSPRQWGAMTAHEMLCHLADSFRVGLGERTFSSAESWLQRHLVKWIALHTPLKWPKGVATRPEVNPRLRGTRPEVFESDRMALIDLLRRFASPDSSRGRHPVFGALTKDEWLIWGFRHVDHHLRQFGV